MLGLRFTIRRTSGKEFNITVSIVSETNPEVMMQFTFDVDKDSGTETKIQQVIDKFETDLGLKLDELLA